MTCFKAFIQSCITDAAIVSFLEKTYNAQAIAMFTGGDDEVTKVSEVSVRIGTLAFSMKTTQYLTEDASEIASKEIYLGTASVKDARHLTQLFFSSFSSFNDDLFIEVMTNIVSHFGGGYITSDVYNDILRTYAIIDSKAEHTAVFV